jgi:hypothetical protein
LPIDDALDGTREVGLGQPGTDDRRRLAAEFERHRRQVFGRGAHHVVADRSRTGKQQMIEGQLRKRLRDAGVALDDRQLVLGEVLADQLGEQRRGMRRHLGHLDQRPIAGGQRCGERRDGEENRVVPGDDDAHGAERLIAHFGPPRLEPQRHRARCGRIQRRRWRRAWRIAS